MVIRLETTDSTKSLHLLMPVRTDKVVHWMKANQRQWTVTDVLLDFEPGVRRIKESFHLLKFRHALQVQPNLVSSHESKLA